MVIQPTPKAHLQIAIIPGHQVEELQEILHVVFQGATGFHDGREWAVCLLEMNVNPRWVHAERSAILSKLTQDLLLKQNLIYKQNQKKHDNKQ